ncbi:hypothetical protein [Gracilibacillus sp. JCM 18860]|uniref:hypothetical protein n=1 Tax=Gracilibacillus sp. JCM 18860 TaxID=1306159 RepID=UPI0006D2976A
MKILFIRSGIIGIVSLFLFYSYPIHATASNLIDISGSLTKTNHLFSIEILSQVIGLIVN